MKFFVKVENINGLNGIVGCTEDRTYADEKWGLGNYFAIYCENSHCIRAEAEKQGYIDRW